MQIGSNITQASLESLKTMITNLFAKVSIAFLYQYIAGKYPLNYTSVVPEAHSQLVPTIVDIGCGFGGLLFPLSG